MGRGCLPSNTPLCDMCYHAKFGRSGSSDMRVIMEICQKNLIPRILPFKIAEGRQIDTDRSATRLPISDP